MGFSVHKCMMQIIHTMEQYSRRNCLVVHGIPESKEDSGDAVLHVFNGQLNVPVTPHSIDRSHRLGRFQQSSNKPRPVIVKFVSYETRRQVFSAKRRLKGTKVVITENLTEAQKRAPEQNASPAGRQVRLDHRRPDRLPPRERREAHHRDRTGPRSAAPPPVIMTG